MNSIIELLRVFKHKIDFLFFFFDIILKLAMFGRKKIIFVIGTPLHGNLGDQAIAYSESLFIDQEISKKFVEIPSPYVIKHAKAWKNVIGESQILIQGGGFLGTLWPNEDKMVRHVIETFPQNYITILPQTLFFDENSKREITRYQRLLEKRPKVLLCVREKYSYELAKKIQLPNVCLVPDMATYLSRDSFASKPLKKNMKHNSVLFCFRRDKEQLQSKQVSQTLLKCLKGMNIDYTSTVVDHSVSPRFRRREVQAKIEEFERYDLIVTDRLHGMILAAIAGVPCLVLNSRSYKTKGVYRWINENDYIQYAEDTSQIESKLLMLLKISGIQKYKQDRFIEKFNELARIIGDRDV